MAKFDIFNEAGKVIKDDESPLNMKFYEQHFGKIVVVVILLLCYINLRYEYEERILSIGRLKKERNHVRYTSIEKWGVLTLQNRPEVIREKIVNSKVDLVVSDESPVEID